MLPVQRRSNDTIEEAARCDESSPTSRRISERLSAFARDILTLLSSTYINVLLLFVPFAITSDFVGWSSSIIFTVNFLGLIPLALVMSYSTTQASKSVGSTVGGLLNITFNNATELIVGFAALWNDEIELIQTTLLGSILSTLLFVHALSVLVLAG
jgi:Ca2+:H+ antiporter